MKSWWNEIKTLQETQLVMKNLNRDQLRKNLNSSKHTNKQKPNLSLNAFIRKALHVLAVKIISHAMNYSSSTCQGKFCSNCVYALPPLHSMYWEETQVILTSSGNRGMPVTKWAKPCQGLQGVSSFLDKLQNTTQVCLSMPSVGLFRRLFPIEILFSQTFSYCRIRPIVKLSSL